jgi:hypothetical protein
MPTVREGTITRSSTGDEYTPWIPLSGPNKVLIETNRVNASSNQFPPIEKQVSSDGVNAVPFSVGIDVTPTGAPRVVETPWPYVRFKMSYTSDMTSGQVVHLAWKVLE